MLWTVLAVGLGPMKTKGMSLMMSTRGAFVGVQVGGHREQVLFADTKAGKDADRDSDKVCTCIHAGLP